MGYTLVGPLDHELILHFILFYFLIFSQYKRLDFNLINTIKITNIHIIVYNPPLSEFGPDEVVKSLSRLNLTLQAYDIWCTPILIGLRFYSHHYKTHGYV